MKTFLQWAEDSDFDVTVPEIVEINPAEKTKAENGVRTGVSQNYPDAYVRAQYPHKYFNPVKATADFDLEAKPKAAPKGTPG